jgi:two-component system CheB/CheR fusion protein
VRVPVLRDGKLAYVLTAVVNPQSFEPLIQQQRLPAGWVSGLVDAEGQFIARVPPKPIGSPASPDYLAAVRAEPEGWYRGRTVEGLDTYTAFVRSELSGWSVGFAIPSELVLGGAKRAAWLMGGGVLLSLALALAIALWLGRRISEPIAKLSSAAHRLGASSEPIAVQTPIAEVRQLAGALNDASLAIRERDRDLRRSEERFRLSQESAIQGFTLFKAVRDEGGRVVDLEYEYINPAGAALGRTTPEPLIGRRLKDMFPGTEHTGIGPQLRRVVETGEPLDAELHYVADGVEGWYRHLAVKIGDGVATSYIDITAKKQLEQELQNRAEALIRADRNKSEFLAMLSHELRNPLAPLSNGLALLRARAGDKAQAAQVLEMMERQMRQLVRLIDDLLDISRIDRGKLELHRERVAADSIVRSAVEIARPNIEARNHELVLRFPGTPVFVDADPVRLAQVLSNVLNNAAKFTAPGGRIELTLKSEDGAALISVADNGIGLAREDLDRIFDMFVQLDASRRQAAGGLGLGLTLARTIVSRHGGSIRAESEGPGKGTRFVIRLPAAAAPRAATPLRSVPAGTAPRRILVVDDNVDAASSLASVLQLSGHEVRAVYSGAEALAAAEEFKPDYVVLDLNMPGIDGVEVGRRLRASPSAASASLIALTGMGQPADVERTRAAGFDHHLTKPVEPHEVLDLLATRR